MVPITRNVDRLHPSEAYVTLNGDPRKAVADQLTTASKTRLENQLGSSSAEDVKKVEHAIRVQLDLL